MKILKINALILLFIYCSFEKFPADSEKLNNSNCIEFIVKPRKPVFIESEPVWIEFQKIDKHCKNDTKFKQVNSINGFTYLTNSKGDYIKRYGGDMIGFQKTINPDTAFFAYNLLRLGNYGEIEDFPNSRLVSFYYLPPDKYILSVLMYRLNYYAGVNIEYEYLDTLTINFEVIKPERNEISAKEEYLKIGNAIGERQSGDKIKDLIDKFNNEFPKSVYSGRLNQLYLYDYPVINPFTLLTQEEQVKYLTGRITLDPDENYNSVFLSKLAKYENIDFESLLNSYILNDPNANLKRFAEQELYELKYKKKR
jgi:hypothetical protein